ncbi:MAG: adenylate/guanylate cyclase domain-containing protein [Acidimicrobiales bacterium]
MNTAQLAAIAGPSRLTRSFAFVDLCGFTEFVDNNDEQIALAEVRQLRSTVREVAPLFGVRVDKWLGDGVMLVGVQSEPVVATVVALQQRFNRHGHLLLRGGIATGEVLTLEGDDYIGRAVNLASRLCDHAEAGQILAHPADLHLPDWVRPVHHFTAALRGMSDTVPVVELVPDDSLLVDPATLAPVASISSLVEHLARPVRRFLSPSDGQEPEPATPGR